MLSPNTSRVVHTPLKRQSVKGLVYGICVWLFLPQQLLTLPGRSIDPSWMLSLDFAVQQRLTFGQDWVFTYGPLGFLSTRLGFLLPWWPLVLFDFFLCGLLLLALRAIFQQTRWQAVPVVSVVAIVFFLSPQKEAATMVFLFFAFFLLRYHQTQQRWTLGLAGFLAALVFFIKLNFGLFAPILFGLSLIYFVGSRRLRPGTALALLAWLAGLMAVGSVLLRVDPIGYVSGGVHIMASFGDVMYVKWQANQEYARTQLILVALTGLVVAFLIGSLLRSGKTLWHERARVAFPLLLIGVLFFLYYKQGYTRQDLIHSLPFHKLVPALVGMLYFFVPVPKFQTWAAFGLGGALLGSGAVAAAQEPHNPGAVPYADVLEGFSRYALTVKANESARRLAPAIRQQIGSATVDVWPHSLDYAFYNHLHYRPRPLVQAYQSYSKPLMRRDYAHLLSERAPQFMLLNPTETFDERYALWDDSEAHLALLQRYRRVATTVVAPDSLLLLERQPRIRTLKKDLMVRQEVPFPALLAAPPGSSWLRLTVRASGVGAVKKLLFQPSDLWITVVFSDGTRHRFRALPPVLESGVLLKKVTTLAEATRYWDTTARGAARVVAVQLSGNPRAFQPNVTAEWYTLRLDSDVL